MSGIDMKQLIITCEACGNVKRYTVTSQAESDQIFREFQCENECGRNLYSYITLGVLHRNNNVHEKKTAQEVESIAQSSC